MSRAASHSEPFRIAVLISGGGTTLRNLLEKIDAGQLPLEIALVISSTPNARGMQFAADAGIPIAVIEHKAFASQDDFSRAIFDNCRRAGCDLVVMGGFLKRITIPADFAGRVVNIHPALVPAFCGEGFYGHRVHEAVLEYGAKLSGCTVHFADNQYDHGPVIVQRAVPVLDDDTPRDAGRAGVRGRVRGVSRGVAVDRHREGDTRRPPRADRDGVAKRFDGGEAVFNYAKSRSSNSSSATSIATVL